MKARVERDLCSGTSLCVGTCPEVFELDEEGISVVKVDQIPQELEAKTKEAAENCPTDAIIVEE